MLITIAFLKPLTTGSDYIGFFLIIISTLNISFVTIMLKEKRDISLNCRLLLEVVSRYGDPKLQVIESYSYLINLRPKISKS